MTNQDFINYCAVDLKPIIKGDATNIEKNIEIFFTRMQSHIVDYLPGIKTTDLTETEETALNEAVMEQALYQLSIGDPTLSKEGFVLSEKAIKKLVNAGLWSYRL